MEGLSDMIEHNKKEPFSLGIFVSGKILGDQNMDHDNIPAIVKTISNRLMLGEIHTILVSSYDAEKEEYISKTFDADDIDDIDWL